MPNNSYVNVLPASGSRPVIVPTVVPVGTFSEIELLLNVNPVGSSFTFVTGTAIKPLCV